MSSGLTVAVSVRLPLELAVELNYYTERMNTSTGKVLTSMLEDILPSFKGEEHQLRLAKAYMVMEKADLLYPADKDQIRERFEKRQKNDNAKERTSS